MKWRIIIFVIFIFISIFIPYKLGWSFTIWHWFPYYGAILAGVTAIFTYSSLFFERRKGKWINYMDFKDKRWSYLAVGCPFFQMFIFLAMVASTLYSGIQLILILVFYLAFVGFDIGADIAFSNRLSSLKNDKPNKASGLKDDEKEIHKYISEVKQCLIWIDLPTAGSYTILSLFYIIYFCINKHLGNNLNNLNIFVKGASAFQLFLATIIFLLSYDKYVFGKSVFGFLKLKGDT